MSVCQALSYANCNQALLHRTLNGSFYTKNTSCYVLKKSYKFTC